MSSKFAQSNGDWVCSDSRCANVNFSRRDKCNKCGKARKFQAGGRDPNKEIGKEFAEKSRGLFSADDWHCKSCGNVNWARRSVCNVCNVTRVNKQGQRTGYGGGYMERDEVVDYKPRDDSDDEFDEFGLKKKKYRKIQGNGHDDDENPVKEDEVNESKSSGQEEADEDTKNKSGRKERHIDEEEEESGDENDLSKYDIWGGDDEDDGKTKSGESNTRKQQSRNKTDSSSESSSCSSSMSSSSSSSSSSTSRSSDRSVPRDEDESKEPREKKK